MSSQDKEILEHLKSPGYHIIPDYFSRSECERLIKHIDQYFQKYPDKIQNDFKEGLGGDSRLFGLENTDQAIYNSLFKNPYFKLLKTHAENPKMTACTVMTGLLKANPNKLVKINSGGGWHRDPGTQHGTKVKTIIYLTDVDTTNGPLTVIPTSKVEHVGQGHVRTDTEKYHMGLRIHDDFVEELRSQGKVPVELTAPAGTMILFDVGNIHMGKPIENGTRYSLTNYFQPNPKSSEVLKLGNKKHYIFKEDTLLL